MPRFSPFSDKRPERLVETVTLTNESTGATDEIALQYLDSVLSDKANDIALRLTIQYVGIPEQEIQATSDLAVDGQYLDLSATLCQNVANLFCMQAERPDRGAVYTCEELFAFVATDETTGVWTQLQEAAQKINAKGNKRKNALRASATNGLKTPCDSTSPTLKSPAEVMRYFAESTNDSAFSANTSPEAEAATT
jgi:hypothetical protein